METLATGAGTPVFPASMRCMWELFARRRRGDLPALQYRHAPHKLAVGTVERDNPVEKLFWGKIPLERATSYFLYHKGSNFRHILHLLKYEGRSDIGRTMGRFIAEEIAGSGFFDGIDAIVPVPLHPRKLRARGYNQSECLASGIADVTGIELDVQAVKRCVHSQTQTRKSAYERWENVAGIFRVDHPERYAGKHILLVDDVLTTGSTVTACADAFAGVEDLRISVLTLAKAAI